MMTMTKALSLPFEMDPGGLTVVKLTKHPKMAPQVLSRQGTETEEGDGQRKPRNDATILAAWIRSVPACLVTARLPYPHSRPLTWMSKAEGGR